MTDTIRIGIIGAGRIVRAEHVPRFRAIDGVELVAVANRTPTSSARAAAELAIPRPIADWRELVRDPEVDAVLVGAWPVLHAPVTIAALDAGKHVLTEARMAATADDARAMLRATRAHPGQVAMIVPASFSDWADATIARLLAAGAIGRVRHVRVEWDGSGPSDPGDFWRWQRAASGDNIMAMGILAEAMTRWLGSPNALTAITRLDAAERPGPDGPFRSDIPDHVLAMAEYPDDVTAVVVMSGRTNGASADGALLSGTDASLWVDFKAQRLELVRPDGRREPVEIRPGDRAEWTAEVDFVGAIRGQGPGRLTDFATGLDYMAFLEAIHRSAADGRRTVIEGDRT